MPTRHYPELIPITDIEQEQKALERRRSGSQIKFGVGVIISIIGWGILVPESPSVPVLFFSAILNAVVVMLIAYDHNIPDLNRKCRKVDVDGETRFHAMVKDCREHAPVVEFAKAIADQNRFPALWEYQQLEAYHSVWLTNKQEAERQQAQQDILLRRQKWLSELSDNL